MSKNMLTKKNVYIYQDSGVDENSQIQTITTFSKLLMANYTVVHINAAEVKQGEWMQTAALFIMPGGSDVMYQRKLQGIGNQHIRNYVAMGGAYLGLCAGGYYGTSYVEFDKAGPLEVLGDRELVFFPGKSIGPVFAPYDYHSRIGARAVTLQLKLPELQQATVYYNGGCYFELTAAIEQTQVLAYYDNQLPAIVEIPYHQGKVILSGVHFEFDPELLDGADPYLKEIKPQLESNNAARILLTQALLQRLGLIL
jgi:glutamine amidotransferase-like uncharacterized protein